MPALTHIRSASVLTLIALAILIIACGGQSADTVSTSANDTVAPEFTLPNANALPGSAISLTQYQSHKPVVLVFYRAYW